MIYSIYIFKAQISDASSCLLCLILVAKQLNKVKWNLLLGVSPPPLREVSVGTFFQAVRRLQEANCLQSGTLCCVEACFIYWSWDSCLHWVTIATGMHVLCYDSKYCETPRGFTGREWSSARRQTPSTPPFYLHGKQSALGCRLVHTHQEQLGLH